MMKDKIKGLPAYLPLFLFITLVFIFLFFLNAKFAFGILFILFVAVCAFINTEYVFYFFLVLLPISFDVPIGIMGVKDVFVADIIFLILFFVMISKKIFKGRIEIKFNLLTYLIIILFFISIISILLARVRLNVTELQRINMILAIRTAVLTQQIMTTVRVGNYVLFLRTLYPLLLYLFVYEEVSIKPEKLKMILKMILFSGMITAIYGWFLKWGFIPESIYSLFTGYYRLVPVVRITSTFDNPQTFGTFLTIPISIVYYYILKRSNNILLWFCGFFMLSIFVFTYTLGAFIALTVSLIVITFFSRRTTKFAKWGIMILIMFLILFIILQNEYMFEKIRMSVTMVDPRKQFPGTLQTRIIKWGRWFEIVRPHILFGLGYPLIWTDNNYVKMIINSGILGFISYFSIIILFIVRAIMLQIKREDFWAIIMIATGIIFLVHGITYELSAVFKMNAYFFIFAAIVSKKLYEEKNIRLSDT